MWDQITTETRLEHSWKSEETDSPNHAGLHGAGLGSRSNVFVLWVGVRPTPTKTCVFHCTKSSVSRLIPGCLNRTPIKEHPRTLLLKQTSQPVLTGLALDLVEICFGNWKVSDKATLLSL